MVWDRMEQPRCQLWAAGEGPPVPERVGQVGLLGSPGGAQSLTLGFYPGSVPGPGARLGHLGPVGLQEPWGPGSRSHGVPFPNHGLPAAWKLQTRWEALCLWLLA
jgi:hypothetical protein